MVEQIPGKGPDTRDPNEETVPFIGIAGKPAIMEALNKAFPEDVMLHAKFKMDDGMGPALSAMGPKATIENWINNSNYKKIELTEATSLGPVIEDLGIYTPTREEDIKRTKFVIVRRTLPDGTKEILSMRHLEGYNPARENEAWEAATKEAEAAGKPGEYQVRIHTEGKLPAYVQHYLINKGP